MKKVAYVAEGVLDLALACSAGTGDAEKAEPVAMWQRNSDTQEIEFAVIGDPYVVNGTKLYTEQQLNELICQLSTAKSLSVTNILINVVPGEDGMGEAVYAKSVAEVEREFSRLSQKLDAVEQQRDELVTALKGVQHVANESTGIVGWHLNGDIATWDELLPEVGAALAKVSSGNTQHPVSTD